MYVGETYKAIVIYERLLDMNSGLQSDGIECSDVWTEDFLHGLYMNTSLAYRTVGSYDKALYYAQLYLNKINKENFMGMSELFLIIRNIASVLLANVLNLMDTICQ